MRKARITLGGNNSYEIRIGAGLLPQAGQQLREMGFELIEIDADDQARFIPSNLIALEPGKVMMHAGAQNTINKVRKAGVEVVEVPFNENICMGGGIYCCTLQLVRDRGPKLNDMK